MSSAAQV